MWWHSACSALPCIVMMLSSLSGVSREVADAPWLGFLAIATGLKGPSADMFIVFDDRVNWEVI